MSSLGDQLSVALTGRYRIERELGHGATATVFEAQDLRHGRHVAIKVLREEIAAVLGVERFQREIRVAAQLSHPHILPLLDSGTLVATANQDPRHWYAMPLASGESLRDRLRREKQLPIPEAVRIAREVCDALDYAHRAGVLHRDVKPENILLSDGHALLADFGIARAMAAGAERLTETGIALGTPSYMSPEQATAEQDLDGRSDLYAVGCVLYEMLTGEPPFTGPTAQAVLAKAITGNAPPITSARPLATALDPIVRRAMEPVPADRYASAADLRDALDQWGSTPAAGRQAASKRPTRYALWGAIVTVLLLTVGAVWWRGRPAAPLATVAGVRVAVLPFRNLGPAGNQYFADGVTTALRNALASLAGIEVIGGTSADGFRDSLPAAVRRALGADYLLRGTVQSAGAMGAGTHVQVSPELIDIREGSGTLRPQVAVSVALEDLFAAQADVARRIADSLGIPLQAEAATRMRRPPTRSVDAYEAYLRGNTDRAIALDSGFARAWAARGMGLAFAYRSTYAPEARRDAQAAIDRALRLQPDLVWAHFALSVLKKTDNEHRDALAAIETARKLAPGESEVAHFLAAQLWIMNRYDDALAEARRAVALDPRNSSAWSRLGRIELWMRDVESAKRDEQRGVVLDSVQFSYGRLDFHWIYATLGELDSARAILRAAPSAVRSEQAVFVSNRMRALWLLAAEWQDSALAALRVEGPRDQYYLGSAMVAYLRGDQRLARAMADSAATMLRDLSRQLPRIDTHRVGIAFAAAIAGRQDEARAQSDSAITLRNAATDGFEGPLFMILHAEIAATLGDRDRALRIIRGLLPPARGLLTPAWLRIDPWFAPLRNDPEFRRLAGLM